eukprot:SAG31_NODE_1631_length_7698_cov_2.501908_2_plen_197_part_00
MATTIGHTALSASMSFSSMPARYGTAMISGKLKRHSQVKPPQRHHEQWHRQTLKAVASHLPAKYSTSAPGVARAASFGDETQASKYCHAGPRLPRRLPIQFTSSARTIAELPALLSLFSSNRTISSTVSRPRSRSPTYADPIKAALEKRSNFIDFNPRTAVSRLFSCNSFIFSPPDSLPGTTSAAPRNSFLKINIC